MDVIAGGKLAAAVSGAGGLGMLGGGYSDDDDWFEREFAQAGNQAVGCGFITWALRTNPELLDAVLARKPKAIFLSFDDPEPFASRIKGGGIRADLPAADASRRRARARLRRRCDRRPGHRGRRARRHAGDASRWCPRSPT